MPNASLMIVVVPLYAAATLLCGAANVAMVLAIVALFAAGMALAANAPDTVAPTRARRRSTGATG